MGKLLPIGTRIYTVIESISDRWFSDDPFHYEVVSGEVKETIRGGYTQYVVQAVNRLGHKSNLLYLKTTNLGKTFFLDRASAVDLAEKVSDYYERQWHGITGETLMRPWRDEDE